MHGMFAGATHAAALLASKGVGPEPFTSTYLKPWLEAMMAALPPDPASESSGAGMQITALENILAASRAQGIDDEMLGHIRASLASLEAPRSRRHVVDRDRGARRAINPDYDRSPERFRVARDVLRRHGPGTDVHPIVARRLVAEGLTPVLDVGCGEGELARHLPAGAWVGVDSSEVMLRRAPPPTVIADAEDLPFPDEAFGSVALLYVLYHLDRPERALAEARRVLRPSGLVAVAAPSRRDSPELAHLLPRRRLTFDAELAPCFLGALFRDVEVHRWDAPLVRLPNHRAVRDYLVGKGVAPEDAGAAAPGVRVPLRVTKRGALLFARR